MPRLRPDALALTRNVLRVLIILNLVGAVVAVVLLASLRSTGPVIGSVFEEGAAARVVDEFFHLRVIIVIAICSVPLTHVVLRRLLAIVQTVGRGDPFVSDNAARLRMIAWALLGMQTLQVLGGALLMAATRTRFTQSSLSITPWVAVLLLFVLARVFQRGTQMREELEGTV